MPGPDLTLFLFGLRQLDILKIHLERSIQKPSELGTAAMVPSKSEMHDLSQGNALRQWSCPASSRADICVRKPWADPSAAPIYGKKKVSAQRRAACPRGLSSAFSLNPVLLLFVWEEG